MLALCKYSCGYQHTYYSCQPVLNALETFLAPCFGLFLSHVSFRFSNSAFLKRKTLQFSRTTRCK